MNEKNKHIIYTAEDISKYLEGKLSPREMHAMEKAAMDDPFLADAMEGYESMKEQEWKGQLAVLRKQLAEQQYNAKVITMHRSTGKWWKTAAAVLVIGAGIAVTYTLTRDNSNKSDAGQVAINTTPAATESTITDTSAITKTLPTQTLGTDVKTDLAKANPVIKENDELITSVQQVAADSIFVYKPGKTQADDIAKTLPPPAVREDVAVNKDKQDEKFINASGNTAPVQNNANIGNESRTMQIQNNQVLANRKEANNNIKAKSELPFNHNFFAQVVGPDNAPLPFSNINIKSENFGTYADVKGNFRLISVDSLVTVEIKSIGYKPKLYTLNSRAALNKIVLTEDAMAFTDVVPKNSTVKNRSNLRRATLLSDSLINVEPADGWENYNTYVANNIEIPDDIISNNEHGEVELSFNVSSNGAISNIKVDRSSCGNNCDALAKKLIEQGPQWKVMKGKAGKARVKLQF